MVLEGQAFLAIWHDIEPAHDSEYCEWHTFEHMPERVGVPGFRSARRYLNVDGLAEKYFTVYDVDELAVLGSAAYRGRLNSPSDWTRRMSPFFLRFSRSACAVDWRAGRGVGGALASVRLGSGDDALREVDLRELAREAAAAPGIVGVHVGRAHSDVTHVETQESRLRARTAESLFDAVVMLEGSSSDETRRAGEALAGRAAALRPEARPALGVYELSYLL